MDLSGNDCNSSEFKFIFHEKIKSLLLKFAGVLIFLGLWYLGGELVANNPDTQNFADFAPEPALKAFSDLVSTGSLIEN